MDDFLLCEVEMNPEVLRQLYKYVKIQDTSVSCQLEVTDEGESGIEITYQSTAAMSCVLSVGSSPPCVTSCSLYEGSGDPGNQVITLCNTCIIL